MSGRPKRSPSLKHGTRGCVIWSSALPMRSRSPIATSLSSSPSLVRFSPNWPKASSMPGSSARQNA